MRLWISDLGFRIWDFGVEISAHFRLKRKSPIESEVNPQSAIRKPQSEIGNPKLAAAI